MSKKSKYTKFEAINYVIPEGGRCFLQYSVDSKLEHQILTYKCVSPERRQCLLMKWFLKFDGKVRQ
jgi:hypothetical protein